MKKIIVLASWLVSGLLLMSPAWAGNRTVNAASLYVRANSGGFFIGTLYNGEGFYSQQDIPSWSYGFAGGGYNGCGWVQSGYTKAGGNTPAECPGPGFNGTGNASRQYLTDHYARYSNDYIPGHNPALPLADQGTSTHVKVGVTTTAYGNYRSGSFGHAYGAIDSSFPMAWRWVSSDGQAVAVDLNPSDPNNSLWVFVPRSALPDYLPFTDGVSRP